MHGNVDMHFDCSRTDIYIFCVWGGKGWPKKMNDLRKRNQTSAQNVLEVQVFQFTAKSRK